MFSLNILRCLLDAGWANDPSFESGRCLRLLERTEAAAVCVVAFENIVMFGRRGEGRLS